MIFETIKRNAQAQQRRVILADPDSLRELANRLETAASFARPGESVSCDLTQDVLILFKPEPTMAVTGIATERFQATGTIEGFPDSISANEHFTDAERIRLLAKTPEAYLDRK